METVLLRGKVNIALTVTALISASLSIVALLAHAVGLMPMYILVNILAAPSLILLLILGIVSYRINENVFFSRLLVGTWAGFVATLAYDGIRLLLWKGGVFSYDPFVSHPIFGSLITGLPKTTFAAITVGWAYHFWNGFSFGIMYALIAGPARWYYAFIWAMFLEIGWLLALPSTLQFSLNAELVAISLIGHGFYGVTLGLLSERFVRT